MLYTQFGVHTACKKSLVLILILISNCFNTTKLSRPQTPTSNLPIYQGADKSLARPGRKQANISVRMPRISFGTLPSRKKNLMTARVSMLLKSRASLTCFRNYFLAGRAKDLSAHGK